MSRNRWATAVLALLLVFAWVWVSRSSGPVEPAVTCAQRLSAEPLAERFAQIRSRLASGDSGGLGAPGASLPSAISADRRLGPPVCVVFLTVSDGGPGKTTLGRADSLEKALDRAVRRQSAGQLQPAPQWLRLDVVSSLDSRRLGTDSLGTLGDPRAAGLVGLASSPAFESALHPEEILGHGLVDRRGSLRASRVAGFFAARPHRAGRPGSELNVRIRVLSYVDGDSGGEPALMTRGHRVEAPWRGVQALSSGKAPNVQALSSGKAPNVQALSSGSAPNVQALSSGKAPKARAAEALEDAAIKAGSFLVRQLGPDGRFVYNYRPKTDREDEDYNILRHAGTTYALFELARITGDDQWRDSGETALGYLRRQFRDCPFAERALCVVEDGEIKLGGSGLAILALLEHPEIDSRPELLADAHRLASGILALQHDDGRFWPHKLSYPGGEAMDHVSIYYPGEALFALARLTARDGDERWLAAARGAARYLTEVRDGDLPDDQLPHDHWLAYGLREIQSLDGELPGPWIDYISRMVDAIAAAQNRSENGLPFADWHGGFYQPPRSAPTSTRLEGLVAAFDLLAAQGSPVKPEAMRATCDATDFLLQTAFEPGGALFLKDPERVLGAFRRSLTAYQTRIDTSQHAMSALLGLSRLVEAGSLDCSESASPV